MNKNRLSWQNINALLDEATDAGYNDVPGQYAPPYTDADIEEYLHSRGYRSTMTTDTIPPGRQATMDKLLALARSRQWKSPAEFQAAAGYSGSYIRDLCSKHRDFAAELREYIPRGQRGRPTKHRQAK